jgi:hypothetical protein
MSLVAMVRKLWGRRVSEFVALAAASLIRMCTWLLKELFDRPNAGKWGVIWLSELSWTNADLAATLEFLARLCQPRVTGLLPDVDTYKLPKIGAALTWIVHRLENTVDTHSTKIESEVLD